MAIHVDQSDPRYSANDLKAALHWHVPEDPRKYWLEIDGICRPIKQVHSLLTGRQTTKFRSSDARRRLRTLGFTIATLEVSAATQSPAARIRPKRFDIATLTPLD